MKNLLSLILLLLHIFIVDFRFASASGGVELLFSIDAVRHGDRAPIYSLPEISTSWAKNELGQLTELGRVSAESLGAKFRKYYIDELRLLPQNFQEGSILVKSSDLARTKETGKFLLKGLYPKQSHKIKIIVTPRKQETILRPKIKDDLEVPFLYSGYSEYLSHSESNFAKRLSISLEYIKNKFDMEISPKKLMELSDILNASQIHKRPLLKNVGDINLKQIIKDGFDFKVAALNNNAQLTCIYAEQFIIHIAELLENYSKGKVNYKHALFLIHDSNIVTVFTLLGAPLCSNPPYLSYMRFEVMKGVKSNTLFVRVSLNDQNIPLCKDKDCSLDELINLIKTRTATICAPYSVPQTCSFVHEVL